MALAETSIHRLIEAQLHDEGYPGLAQAVASATGTPSTSLPHLPLSSILAGGDVPESLKPRKGYTLNCAVTVGQKPVARFSGDGRHLAVGTADGAVQLFDWESLARGSEGALRRYADHASAVNDVDFHPIRSTEFCSASEDATLHFYDTASNEFLGPSRTCTDTHPARSVAFHPQGDHLLVGTTHAALHLYDMATFRCFLAADASHHHRAAITDARWASDGSLFASCAAAEVKLWQGHNFACCATLSRAHGGTPVGSVNFSKSARYLITSGADSAVKLWDVRMVRDLAAEMGRQAAPQPVRTYEGGGQTAARRVASLSHDEKRIVGADENSSAALVWLTNLGTDAPLGGEVVAKHAGHSAAIRCVVHNPKQAAFVTCSEDATVRAWVAQ